MTRPEPTLSVKVNVRNPGQFFACCGLLELAHRLWPGAEAWFDVRYGQFLIITPGAEGTLTKIVETLKSCEVSGLTEEERREQAALETEKRRLKKQKPPQDLAPEKENRRKELGQRARAGALQFSEPIPLLLDWWQANDDEATPKTWAGRQEIHKIVRSAQEALSGIDDQTMLFDHSCVMRMPKEYAKQKTDGQKAVAPFYFDARRFSHPLDAGFSLDALEAETIAHPAVELFSLIGLQRFRPIVEQARKPKVKAYCEYWAWYHPLSASVSAGVVCGAASVPARQGYRFPIWARDDEKRYGAFGWATTIGDDT